MSAWCPQRMPYMAAWCPQRMPYMAALVDNG